MGKTDTCAAEGCNHTSRGFCSFYYFPTHNPWRSLWIQAIGKKPVDVDGILTPWEPTNWDRLCSCHFSNPPNPKSRRLDAKWVVPDLFPQGQPAAVSGATEDVKPPVNLLTKTLPELPKQSTSGIPDMSQTLAEITQTLSSEHHTPASQTGSSREHRKIAPKPPSQSPHTAGLKKDQTPGLTPIGTLTPQMEKTQTLAEILSTPPQRPPASLLHPSLNVTPGSMAAAAVAATMATTNKQSSGGMKTSKSSTAQQSSERRQSPARVKSRYQEEPMNLLSERGKQGSLLAAIKDYILTLCKTSLAYDEELNIEGLVGITLDRKDVLLLNLHECHKGANILQQNEGIDIYSTQENEDEDVDPDWRPGGVQTTPRGNRARRGRKRSYSHGNTLYHDSQKRTRVHDTPSPSQYSNMDTTAQAIGDDSFSMPVIKIEPRDPDEDVDHVERLDTRRLQDEIQAANTSDTINSLSSKIVQMVQSQHMPEINQSLQHSELNQAGVEQNKEPAYPTQIFYHGEVATPSSLEGKGDQNDSDYEPSSDSQAEEGTVGKMRRSYTVEEKIKAVDTIRRNQYQLSYASRLLNIDRNNLQRWVKRYDEMLGYSSKDTGVPKSITAMQKQGQGPVQKQKAPQKTGTPTEGKKKTGPRGPRFPILDEKLCEYYMQLEAAGQHCPDAILVRKARQIAVEMDCAAGFKGSVTYIRKWKQRHFQPQAQPEYEELAQRVRNFYKSAYAEGRDCSLEMLVEQAELLAADMDCKVFKDDPNWLHKWKMHYFSDACLSATTKVSDFDNAGDSEAETFSQNGLGTSAAIEGTAEETMQDESEGEYEGQETLETQSFGNTDRAENFDESEYEGQETLEAQSFDNADSVVNFDAAEDFDTEVPEETPATASGEFPPESSDEEQDVGEDLDETED